MYQIRHMADFAHWFERITFFAALAGFPSLAAAAWFAFLIRRIEREEDLRAERARAEAAQRDHQHRMSEYERLSDPLFRYRAKTGS